MSTKLRIEGSTSLGAFKVTPLLFTRCWISCKPLSYLLPIITMQVVQPKQYANKNI